MAKKTQITIYLDSELLKKIKKESEKEQRNLNGQITFILNSFFDGLRL